MTLPRTRVIALLVCGLAFLAACGAASKEAAAQPDVPIGTTHEQYQQGIQKILSSDDSRAATQLFTDAVATDYGTEQCTQRVRELHQHLRSIMTLVEELRPPADAADAQREFLEAAQESVRLVGVAADDVAKERLTCGQPLNHRIYGMPSTVRAQEALETLKKRGYVVFGE